MSSQEASRDSLPESGPGSLKRRRYFLVSFALLLLATAVVFRAVLLPFALAIVLAYVLSPAIAAGERAAVRGRKAPRWVVVLLAYLLLLGALSALVAVAVPRLTAEINRLTREAPRAVAVVENQWLPQVDKWLQDATAPYLEGHGQDVGYSAPSQVQPGPAEESGAIHVKRRDDGGYDVELPQKGLLVTAEGEHVYRIRAADDRQDPKGEITATVTQIISRAMENTEQTTVTLLHTAQKIIQALTRGIFTFFLTLMISAYLLITSDRIFEFFRSFYSSRRRRDFDDVLRRIDRGLAGVVRGQLIICLVNGILSGIGFYFLGVRYWLFLTLLAAVMSIIPIFGAILSSIPAVLIALSDGLGLALLILGWIVIIHQIEANLLNPKIMGDAARVHPVLVVFALLAGAHIGGVLGALLGVPVLSILQSLFLYIRERALGIPRSPSMPPPAPSMPPPTASSQ